jgi:hypothetical protein
LITPDPKQKEGKGLRNHVITFAASAVEGMILNIKKTNVTIPPIMKWIKKLAT